MNGSIDFTSGESNPIPIPEPIESSLAYIEMGLRSGLNAEDLGLDENSLKSLKNLGFKNPTPIQKKSIPELISGHDTVGLAQTGSGKTLAFSLPMMQLIDPELNDVQAIVLVPTRELAQQVLEVVTSLGDSRKIRAV